MTNYFIKRYHTDFGGTARKVDYVGPYMQHQKFALRAQYESDLRHQSAGETQITFMEWVEVDGDKEEVIDTAGSFTRSRRNAL